MKVTRLLGGGFKKKLEQNVGSKDFGLSHLVKNMKRTKHNKFRAACRLGKEQRDLSLIISLSSSLVIGLSVAPVLLPQYFLDCKISSVMLFISVIMSIVIIVLTLTQEGRNRSAKAKILEMGGNELVLLFDKARALESKNKKKENEVNEIRDEYARILSKYDVNHEDIDYLDYKRYHAAEFLQNSKWKKTIFLYWIIKLKLSEYKYWIWFVVFIFLLLFSLYMVYDGMPDELFSYAYFLASVDGGDC